MKPQLNNLIEKIRSFETSKFVLARSEVEDRDTSLPKTESGPPSSAPNPRLNILNTPTLKINLGSSAKSRYQLIFKTFGFAHRINTALDAFSPM